ncbi:MAG: type I-E CRISPR-associated protein Cse1/CasA [Ruminococcus sp.]|nr:type I-E CRISPR-associated protein Cse1/CasA [Ruminococcus sp.]
MNETEFNLIDEPWIRVMDSSCRVSEVSLKEALLRAHEYKALSGELPTQDIAVMRLLLAVLHTVYSRVDENGAPAPLDDEEEDDAIDRWKALWDKGRFSEKAVSEYLDKWHERFWLFHPERPFGQVAGLSVGTDYDAPKLNGEISESSNKTRFFSMYSGDSKAFLTYPQAARWLLYLNAFDDNSSHPGTGAGWLGKLGLTYLVGKNLFETIVLNLVMINNDIVQSEQKPIWEKETVSSKKKNQIPGSNNLAELYTLQSRRIILNRKDGRVVSFKLLGGDFFEKENAFFEPMTVWNKPKKDNDPYTPRRHDHSKQMWREFAVLFDEKANRNAGVINWFRSYLKPLLPRAYLMRTAITAVEYGDKDFFVQNVFSDSLTMHADLLTDLGADWRDKIEKEISRCEELAKAAAALARGLYVASGGSNSDKDKHYMSIPADVKSQIYYRLDIPFREWLRSIDPECADEKLKYAGQLEWQQKARNIASSYAEELSSQLSEIAFAGHKVKVKDQSGKTERTVLYSAPRAMNKFYADLNRIYQKE